MNENSIRFSFGQKQVKMRITNLIHSAGNYPCLSVCISGYKKPVTAFNHG